MNTEKENEKKKKRKKEGVKRKKKNIQFHPSPKTPGKNANCFFASCSLKHIMNTNRGSNT